MKKLNIYEYRKERKLFFSDCCKDKFETKSNGLYTYYVCKCGKKTTPINGKGKMLDLHGEIKKNNLIKKKHMTTEEFNNMRFGAGMSALYKGEIYPIIRVDFEEQLLGLNMQILGAEEGEIDWVRCENVVLVSEPKQPDFTCPHSGESFSSGDRHYRVYANKFDVEPVTDVIDSFEIEGIFENIAHFHTAEDAIKWNINKFGSEE